MCGRVYVNLAAEGGLLENLDSTVLTKVGIPPNTVNLWNGICSARYDTFSPQLELNLISD